MPFRFRVSNFEVRSEPRTVKEKTPAGVFFNLCQMLTATKINS